MPPMPMTGPWPPRLLIVGVLILLAASISAQAHAHALAHAPDHDPPPSLPLPPPLPLEAPPPLSPASLQVSSISLVKVTPPPQFQQSSRDDSCVPLNLDSCRYDWAAASDPVPSSSSSASPAKPNPNNNLPTTSGRRPQEASPPGGAFQVNPPSFISIRKSAWSQLPKPPPNITDILSRISPALKQLNADANSTAYAPLRYLQSLTCLELAFAANNATLNPVICPLASVQGRSSPVAEQQAKPQSLACPMDGVSALRTTYMCTMYATSVRDTLLLADSGGGARLPADWLDVAVHAVFPRVCPKSLNLEQCSDVDFVLASLPHTQRDPLPNPSSSSPAWWNTTATNALQMLVGKAVEDAGPLAVTEEAEGCGLSAPRTRKLVADAGAHASAAGTASDTTIHDDGALSQRRRGNGLGNSGPPGPPAASYSFTYAQEADVQAKLCVFGCKTEYCTRPVPTQAWSIGAIVGLVIGLAFVALIILAATVPRCDRKVGGEDDLAVHERAAFRFWLGFLWLENAYRRCRRSRKEAVATPSDSGVVTPSGRRMQRWTRRLTTRRKTPKARDVEDSASTLGDKPSGIISSTGMVASSTSNPPSQVATIVQVQMSPVSIHGALSPTRSTTPHSSMRALASPVPVPVPPTPDLPTYPPPVALMRTCSSGYIDTASIPTNISLYHAPLPPPPMPDQLPHFVSAVPPPPIDPSFVSIHRPPTTYTQPLAHAPESPIRSSSGNQTSSQMHIYSVLDVFGEPRVVQHAYLPQQKDEIELCLGDLVFVTNERENGWVDGINLTRLTEGLFPLVCTTPQSSLHLCSVLVETPPGVHPFDVAGSTAQVAPATASPDPKPTAASGAVRASRGQLADRFPRTASLPEYLRDQAPTPQPPVPVPPSAVAPQQPLHPAVPSLARPHSNAPRSRVAGLDGGGSRSRNQMSLREFLATTHPPASPSSPPGSAAGGAPAEYMDGDRGAQAYSMGLPPVMVPWFVAGGGQVGPHQGAGGYG